MREGLFDTHESRLARGSANLVGLGDNWTGRQ